MNSNDILDYGVFEFSENKKYEAEIAKISRLMIRNAFIFAGAMWALRAVVFGFLSYDLLYGLSERIGIDYWHIQNVASRTIEALIIGYLFGKHFFKTRFQTQLYLVANLVMVFTGIILNDVILNLIPNIIVSFIFSYAYHAIAIWVITRSYSFLEFENFERWIIPLFMTLGSVIIYQLLISAEMYSFFGIVNALFSGILVYFMLFTLKRAAIRTFRSEEQDFGQFKN